MPRFTLFVLVLFTLGFPYNTYIHTKKKLCQFVRVRVRARAVGSEPGSESVALLSDVSSYVVGFYIIK